MRFPYRRISGLTKQQQHELWRNFEAVAFREEIITFSSVGDLEVTTSGPKRVRDGGIIRIVGDLSTALTGDTDVDVLLNGDVVHTFTIADGETDNDELTEVRAKGGDLLVLDVTAVGTGSARGNFDIIMRDSLR